MKRSVSISCFVDGLKNYPDDVALVAIDVIRATTTATTALVSGRRCYPVASVAAARALAQEVPDALLVGEVAGEMPEGFDLTNSPAQLAALSDRRPVILLSSSGTQLMLGIQNQKAAYIGSFRNYNATIDHLAEHASDVVLIGAGSRGEFREEDQMCCAWIAEGLIEFGFSSADHATRDMVERWRGLPRDAFMMSRSVDYLRRTNQLADLNFILEHFDDIGSVCRLSHFECELMQAAGRQTAA
ncbi:MAG TPA: 2-phosphosulfolactate phosphatase [Terriglobia bacterium]|nr:2-phosphosulfolactate phosphatase [Terriglobia bacterium]